MYEEMTYENILKSMFERMPDMDSRENSMVFDSVAAVAYSLEKAYFMLGNFLDLVFADTSAGEFLERFGRSVNVERKEAVPAVRYGIFDKKIPTGARFTAGSGNPLIFYAKEFEEEKEGRYFYLMECETAGKAGNEEFEEFIPVEHISGLGMAGPGNLVSDGTDRESDESFRERIFHKIQLPSTSGNKSDYYNWAMECPGVGAAGIFPLDNGPGTVGVVIVDEDRKAAGQALVDSVAEHIEAVRPIGATVTVESAREKEIHISAKVRLSQGVRLGTAQDALEGAVDSYFRENAFQMNYVSMAKLGSLLLAVPGVEDYTELKMNGEAQNAVVGDKEIAVTGTVRLEVLQ